MSFMEEMRLGQVVFVVDVSLVVVDTFGLILVTFVVCAVGLGSRFDFVVFVVVFDVF